MDVMIPRDENLRYDHERLANLAENGTHFFVGRKIEPCLFIRFLYWRPDLPASHKNRLSHVDSMSGEEFSADGFNSRWKNVRCTTSTVVISMLKRHDDTNQTQEPAQSKCTKLVLSIPISCWSCDGSRLVPCVEWERYDINVSVMHHWCRE